MIFKKLEKFGDEAAEKQEKVVVVRKEVTMEASCLE